MSFFRKLKAPFHDDWCPECTAVLDVMQKQLYMLPMLVGNYTSHADAAYSESDQSKQKSRYSHGTLCLRHPYIPMPGLRAAYCEADDLSPGERGRKVRGYGGVSKWGDGCVFEAGLIWFCTIVLFHHGFWARDGPNGQSGWIFCALFREK